MVGEPISKLVGLGRVNHAPCLIGNATRHVGQRLLPILLGDWSAGEYAELRLLGRYSAVLQYQLPSQMVERRAQVVQKLTNKRIQRGAEWLEENLPFPGGLIGLELARNVARLRLVVGDQLALDRVQVLLCAVDAVVNGGERNLAGNLRVGHPLPLEAHERGQAQDRADAQGPNRTGAQAP